MSRFRIFGTTFWGLEDLAAAEVSQLLGTDVEADVAKVFAECDARGLAELVFSTRSLNRVFLQLVRTRFEGLDDIERAVREVDFQQLMGRDQSFGVEAERHGTHPFTSMDVASRVGRAVIESCLSSSGWRPRVDLKSPDVPMYALVRDDEFLLGINLTGPSLHKRFYRVADVRSTLPPTLAFLMVMFSDWNENGCLLDPFCGSATIPIEAALYAMRVPPNAYRRREEMPVFRLKFIEQEVLEEALARLRSSERRWLRPRVYGTDVSPRAVDAARRNVAAAGLEGVVRVELADALNLERWEGVAELPERVHVVTDPPFGIRMGLSDPYGFYLRAFSSVRRAIREPRLVAIFSKQAIALRALGDSGWNVSEVRRVKYGHLEVALIRAEA
ncbi:MAG: THUMP domain-containing protein [Aigarchaeota archaeon]|nr:THUMP domain-containing protein [Candidatus Calditenuis fumarioli]